MYAHLDKEATGHRRRTVREHKARVKAILRRIVLGVVDPEEAVFPKPPRTEGWETW